MSDLGELRLGAWAVSNEPHWRSLLRARVPQIVDVYIYIYRTFILKMIDAARLNMSNSCGPTEDSVHYI